jgi:hypothetical protein
MGDRTWTGISFSGKMNHEHATGLVKELLDQHCRCDDGEGEPGEITVAHLVLDTCFYDEECNYAQMEGVETFCREHGVSYLKTWSSGGGYGAGYSLYNAVVDQTFEVPGDDEPALGLTELTQFAKEGKTLQDVIAYLEAISNFRAHYPLLELVQ